MYEGINYVEAEKYRNVLKAELVRYDWEWFCSLNMKSNRGIVEAERDLRKWRHKVIDKIKMQICYMGVLNLIPHPHIHLLMAGTNRFNCNLRNANTERCESSWSMITKQKAVIEPIYHIGGAAEYIARRNTIAGHFELINPYGKDLIDRKALEAPDMSLPTKDEQKQYYERVKDKVSIVRLMASSDVK